MKKVSVYLDNCCFNRPYDNQNKMDYENNANPFEERKNNIALWKSIAMKDCDLCGEIAEKAAALMTLGLRQKDASHLSCAIFAKADFFLTTDIAISIETRLQASPKTRRDVRDFRLAFSLFQNETPIPLLITDLLILRINIPEE